MEIDLPLIPSDNIAEKVDALTHLEQKPSLVDKELAEQSFDTSSDSEKLAREEDITENSLYITTCEGTPNTTLEFSKKANSDSMCLVDKFELDSYVRPKDDRSIISRVSSLDNEDNSILNSALVDALDATLLCDPKENTKDDSSRQDIIGKSSSDSAEFHDALDSRQQSSDSTEFHDTLDAFVEKSNTDKENIPDSNDDITPKHCLEASRKLEKDIPIELSSFVEDQELLSSDRREASSSSGPVCNENLSLLEDRTYSANTLNQEFPTKLVNTIDNPNNGFSMHKLNNINQYIDQCVNENILEFDKYDLPRKSDDSLNSGCYVQKDSSHLTEDRNRDEAMLPIIRVRYPELTSSDANTCNEASSDSMQIAGNNSTIGLSTKETVASASIFLSDSALNEQSISANIDPFKTNFENISSKNLDLSGETDINSCPSTSFKDAPPKAKSKSDFSLNCPVPENFDITQINHTFKRHPKTKPRAVSTTTPKTSTHDRGDRASSRRHDLLKRKLSAMLASAEDEEGKAVKHLIVMKEEKSQLLQEMIYEIERIATKYEF